jgi:hypothetical protein
LKPKESPTKGEKTVSAEQEQTQETTQLNSSILVGLSTAGGGGIVLAMIAAGIGVVEPTVDSNLIGLLVLTGVAILIVSIIAWFMYVQPHKNFDDINQPLVEEHHSDH